MNSRFEKTIEWDHLGTDKPLFPRFASPGSLIARFGTIVDLLASCFVYPNRKNPVRGDTAHHKP